jgi:hypothetical protein
LDGLCHVNRNKKTPPPQPLRKTPKLEQIYRAENAFAYLHLLQSL